VLLRVIVTEILETASTSRRRGASLFRSSRVLRKRRRQIVEHTFLKHGIVDNDRTLVADAVAQAVQKLGRGSALPSARKEWCAGAAPRAETVCRLN